MTITWTMTITAARRLARILGYSDAEDRADVLAVLQAAAAELEDDPAGSGGVFALDAAPQHAETASEPPELIEKASDRTLCKTTSGDW